MDTTTLFSGTINLSEKALNLRSRRHELILSNIANADTPNFKAFDLMVEEALARHAPSDNDFALERTNPAHMTKDGAIDQPARPQMRELSTRVTLRGDGNTVDMDQEMYNLATNQLHYRISSQIIARKFQSLKNIIQGGKS
jgi:flagellar basal-body rod protein FlgB